MDRSQLRNMIDSGRAIALDCHAIGQTIPADDPIGLLFKTDIMNKSVLMKRYEPTMSSARQPVVVATLVYFPYDFDNPYEGGESLVFNDIGFHNSLSFKIGIGNTSAVSVRSGRGMGPVKRISHVEARPHKVLSFCW